MKRKKFKKVRKNLIFIAPEKGLQWIWFTPQYNKLCKNVRRCTHKNCDDISVTVFQCGMLTSGKSVSKLKTIRNGATLFTGWSANNNAFFCMTRDPIPVTVAHYTVLSMFNSLIYERWFIKKWKGIELNWCR